MSGVESERTVPEKKKEKIRLPMDNIHGAVRKFPDAGIRNIQKSVMRVQS